MRPKRKTFRWVALAILLWGGLAAGGFSFKYRVPEAFWEAVLPLPEGDWVTVLVEPGLTARQAAAAFEAQGALEGTAGELAYWMTRLGIDRQVRPGRYRVIRSSPWYMARQLRGTVPALMKMTIIPGMDVFSLRSAVPPGDRVGGRTQDALHRAVMDDGNYPQEMRSRLPSSEESRITFLLPETYYVVQESSEELVRAAAAAWWERFGTDSAHVNNLEEAAIIASMVEREVLRESECPRVAGVIGNRLRRGMPLQIDATIIYAWKLKNRRLTRVLNSDLSVNSPYNTYRQVGLPPTPICIPGEAAWEAALDPEKNEYYYYVAGKNGYHYFAKTYPEHLENIRRARSER